MVAACMALPYICFLCAFGPLNYMIFIRTKGYSSQTEGDLNMQAVLASQRRDHEIMQTSKCLVNEDDE